MARCLGHHGMYVTALRIHGLAILFDDKVPWTSWSNLWLLLLPCRGGGGVSLTFYLCSHWACSSCLVLPCWMARRLGHHGMYFTALGIHGIAIRFDGKVPWT